MPITHFSINFINFILIELVVFGSHAILCNDFLFTFFFSAILSHTFRCYMYRFWLFDIIRFKHHHCPILECLRLDVEWNTCISTTSSLTLITLSTKSMHKQKCLECLHHSDLQSKLTEKCLWSMDFEPLNVAIEMCAQKFRIEDAKICTHHWFWL